MNDERQKLVVVAGPTASGKSSLAIELALAFGGEIVNADSMQVYKGMDVGTGKPSLEEREKIPHHLYDVVEPDQEFNAALYRSVAIPLIREISSRKAACLVVGGTGLYIKTLLGGLLHCPPADPELRGELRRVCEERGPSFLHERLKALDPESAKRIHPNDRIRIIRALEVIDAAKERFSMLSERHRFGESPFQVLKICLQTDREELYHRINERCLKMIREGLLAETQHLLESGYSPDLKPMKSLGYRHMVEHLQGLWGLDEAVYRFQMDTRRYAKRQLTWFRADPEILWFSPEERETICTKVREFLL